MAIIYTDDMNFNNEIKNENVLVDFYADWCGPCRMLSPILENINETQCNTKIIKVNVDNCPNTAKSFGIMSIPTLIYLKNGQLVEKKIGLCSKDDILEMINK